MDTITGVKVQLLAGSGNAFVILAKVATAMTNAGVAVDVVDKFKEEAMSGDYDHLLRTCMKYVEVT